MLQERICLHIRTGRDGAQESQQCSNANNAAMPTMQQCLHCWHCCIVGFLVLHHDLFLCGGKSFPAALLTPMCDSWANGHVFTLFPTTNSSASRRSERALSKDGSAEPVSSCQAAVRLLSPLFDRDGVCHLSCHDKATSRQQLMSVTAEGG